jgi:predicted naringenin-chalcone synthase
MICIELCTLHYQKGNSLDHILSNALFGDGAAAALIESSPSGPSLSVDDFHCEIEFSGKEEMAWNISDSGFEMSLSSFVPELIQRGIKKLANKILERTGIYKREVDFYAIHPGGRRILDTIVKELQIDRKKSLHSYEILKNYGNMSSATILFVLKKILDEISPVNINKSILGFAFGPGLTIETVLMHSVFDDREKISLSENFNSSEYSTSGFLPADQFNHFSTI